MAILLLAQACAALAEESTRPPWLAEKITELSRLPVGNPPRRILRVSYQGRTAYYLTPTCCDIPSELYDEGGKLACYPSGGFAGGDGRCPGFALPDDPVIIWSDPRGAVDPAASRSTGNHEPTNESPRHAPR